MDSTDSTHDVSEGDKDSIRSQNRDYACGSMTKNLASFCQYPEKLGVTFKTTGLVCLSNEILRQDSTQAGAAEAAVIGREVSTTAGECL